MTEKNPRGSTQRASAPPQAEHVRPPDVKMDEPSTKGKEVVTFEGRLRRATPEIASRLNMPVEQARSMVYGLLGHVAGSEQKAKFDNCTMPSILNCIKTAYDLHLPIDARKLVHLIPYEIKVWDPAARKNVGTGQYEAKLQIGKGAYVNIIKREYPGAIIHTGLVWKDDEFEVVEENGEAKYVYKPKNPFRSDYGHLLGSFCYIAYQSGGRWFSTLTRPDKGDIDKGRAMAAENSKAWNNFYGEMAQKFSIKRAGKLLMDGVQAWADIEAKDNEQYDLSAGDDTATGGMRDVTPRSSREASEERLRREEEDARQQHISSSASAAKVTDVDIGDTVGAAHGAPMPEDGAARFDDLPGRTIDDFGTCVAPDDSQLSGGNTPRTEETGDGHGAGQAQGGGSHAPLPDISHGDDAISGAWDGKTVFISGKPVVQEFPSAVAAGRYLQKVVASRKHNASRKALLAENALLMKALIAPRSMGLVDALTKLTQEGEEADDRTT